MVSVNESCPTSGAMGTVKALNFLAKKPVYRPHAQTNVPNLIDAFFLGTSAMIRYQIMLGMFVLVCVNFAKNRKFSTQKKYAVKGKLTKFLKLTKA